DDTVTNDIAASSGDAIASGVETMAANEDAATMPSSGVEAAAPNLSFSRLRTCYDGTGTVVPNCSPMSSVRKIITHVSVDGSRSGSVSVTGGNTTSWSGAVHRVADDTITRNFNGSTEQSRTHDAVGMAHDTTS